VTSILNANGEYYTYNQDTTSELDNRFLSFGAIGCLASVEPSSATAMTVYGILYARFTFEYYELCPIATSVTSLRIAKGTPMTSVGLCNDPDCKRCSRKCLHSGETTKKPAKQSEKS